MGTNVMSFNKEQFNRLFPFYILINKNLIIDDCGNTLKKLCGTCINKHFKANFRVKNKDIELIDFNSFQHICHQHVEIEINNKHQTILSGQFEYLDASKQMLFVGIPSFSTMEKLEETGLTIHDFTNHEPLIDTLTTINKTEKADEKSKKIMDQANRHKHEVAEVAETIQGHVLFPMQHPDPLFRISTNGEIIIKNAAAEELKSFDYKEKNRTSEDFWKFISTDKSFANDPWTFEATSNNKTYSFLCKGLQDNSYYNAFGRDITQQKKNEDELLRLSLVASANESGVLFTNANGKIIWVNEGFCKLIGFTEKEIIGKNTLDFCKGPMNDENALKKIEDSIENTKAFNTELIYYRKDGSWFWGRLKGQLYNLGAKQDIQYFDMVEDITGRKNIEEALDVTEKKYRSIIANMQLGLLEVDNNGTITYANSSYCAMSGHTLKELMGRKASESIWGVENISFPEKKKKNQKRGVGDSYQIETKDKKGNPKWWLVSDAPRYDDKGGLVGSVFIFLDITDQKQLETDLIGASKKAENLARTKEIFLANMSHEIRTPMNAIMGMTNQLSKTDLVPQQKFYLDIIHSASENLLAIINDILDLSKIEAGKLSIENIGLEFSAVTKRVMQVLAHKAEEKGLLLKSSYFDKNISPVLIGDPYRLNQVLLNLMSNAIKFTEKGSVDLVLKLIKNKENSQVIQVQVKDTGIGMDEIFVQHLFEKFTQENESISRKYGGTGLGMSICKDLITLMGGEIFAESTKGSGTTISFIMEFKKGSHKDLPEKKVVQFSPDFLANRKILITDDNELNRLIASIILQNYGAEVTVAASGKLAIEATTTKDFDIILMDIQMPEMDGFQTTKKIRQKQNTAPIIAFTAEAIKGERQKCLDAGMNDYLSKPINEEEFLTVLDKWLVKKKSQFKPENSKAIETEPTFDLSILKSISRGNEMFVQKMVNIFCDQTPQMLKEIEDSYYLNDLDKMGALAHKMKASVDNLNIIALKRLVKDIKKMSKESVRNPNLPKIFKEANEIISAVVGLLRKQYPA